ncbi:hypothetical protein LX32DRAFT_644065 [Colletotrichum zoysiae]|uniref:Uncharacterized protein n=1 Tax=Colletotrichum zoysiae TaxID=1216348 RepID=A0AAD9LX40_9PEZI|nr:hypothetical protein LX32DRAFT_644065 [Colletotrichum zoysiae]
MACTNIALFLLGILSPYKLTSAFIVWVCPSLPPSSLTSSMVVTCLDLLFLG